MMRNSIISLVVLSRIQFCKKIVEVKLLQCAPRFRLGNRRAKKYSKMGSGHCQVAKEKSGKPLFLYIGML